MPPTENHTVYVEDPLTHASFVRLRGNNREKLEALAETCRHAVVSAFTHSMLVCGPLKQNTDIPGIAACAYSAWAGGIRDRNGRLTTDPDIEITLVSELFPQSEPSQTPRQNAPTSRVTH